MQQGDMLSEHGKQPRGGEDLSIKSYRPATATLNSSDAHPKQRSQFLSSIDSAPSAPEAPESLDTTHVTLSYKKSICTVSSTSSYSLKDLNMGVSTGVTRV